MCHGYHTYTIVFLQYETCAQRLFHFYGPLEIAVILQIAVLVSGEGGGDTK